jgi:hypothetical protein
MERSYRQNLRFVSGSAQWKFVTGVYITVVFLYATFVFLRSSSIRWLLYSHIKCNVVVFQRREASHIVVLQEWKVVFLGYICFSHVFLSILYRNYNIADVNTAKKTALLTITFLHCVSCLVLLQ